MKSDWKECTLAELGEIVGGATPSTKDEQNYGGDIAWITPKDLSTLKGRFISRGERNITEKGLRSCSAQIMPKNAVLFSSRAPIGYVAIAANPVCTNQGFKSIVANSDNDPMFLYYLLKYNKNAIEAMGSGTTFKEVSGSTMRGIRVYVPISKAEQQRIAAILSALDEKIAINRAINENLERQLDAFFENIFHDINGEVALGNVVKTISGGTPSRKHIDYYENGTICWVKSKELSGGYIFDTEEHINDLALAKSSAKIIPPHAILVAMYGATVGSYGIITKAMACNQAICALIDSENYPYTYLYQILRTQQRTLTNMAIGSAQQNISQILIKQLPLHNDTDTIAKFHTFAQPLQKRIELLEYENKQIMSIRDTLLPKLMSGEIDVSTV